MTEAIFTKLNQIMSEVFDDDVEVTPQTTASDVEGWDSLSHIQLIMAIEKGFKIRFSTTEIAGLKTVGQLADLISAKQAK